MNGVAILPSSDPTTTSEPRESCASNCFRVALATCTVPSIVVAVARLKTSLGTSSKRP